MRVAEAKPKRIETGIASCCRCRQAVAVSEQGNPCEPMTEVFYPNRMLGRTTEEDGIEVWRCNIAFNDETKTWDSPHRCPGNPPLGCCRGCGSPYFSIEARQRYFVDESFCWACENRRWD